MNLVIVNTSPRGTNSTSEVLLAHLRTKLSKDLNSENICISNFNISPTSDNSSIFSAIENCDKLLIASPLYVDSLPARTVDFLDNLSDFLADKKDKNINVYGLVNCGLVKGYFCEHALNMLELFCNENSLNWRLGLGIGCGEVIKATDKSMPLKASMKHEIDIALSSLCLSIANNNKINDKNIFAQLKLSNAAFIFMGNMFWRKQVKFKPFTLSKKMHKS